MSDDASTALILEKIKFFAAKPNENTDNLRHVIGRLNYQVLSQEKGAREKTLDILCRKQSGNLAFLINLLTEVNEISVACSLASILHECITPKPGMPRLRVRRNSAISQLVHANGCRILVKLIVHYSKEGRQVAVEPLLCELIMVLSPLSLKDAKFSIKARLLGSVKTFCSLLKTYINHSKLLLPILQIVKALSKSGYTTPLLVKNGVLSSIEKTIATNGTQPTPKFKASLDILNHLSKKKICCIKLTKTSIMHHLLRIIDCSDKYEGKVKVKICKPVLLTLQHLATSKAGRKYIRDNNGTASLYKFCISAPDEKSYDTLLAKVCGVINFCLENKDFPLENMQSPAPFPLSTVQQSHDFLRSTSNGDSVNDSGDESNDDDEDEAEDGQEELINTDSSLRDESDTNLPIRVQRNLDDLLGYSSFFQELLGSPDNHAHLKSNSVDGIFPLVGDKHESNHRLSYDELKLGGRPSEMSWNCVNHSKSLAGEDSKKRASLDVNLLHDAKMAKPSTETVKESPLAGLKIFCDINTHYKSRSVYSIIASRTRSVIPFVKTAYPELVGGEGTTRLEPLNVKDRTVCRSKLLTCVERGMHPSALLSNVVFDLDALIKEQEEPLREFTNNDETRVGEKDPNVSHLKFESRFECGNLRKVIQIGQFEYNLILTPDVNSTKHLQWFYFEVSNMEANKPYVFNIINCEKQNSQFNFGMKPLMFSVCDAVRGQPKWVRTGTDICYFRNAYHNPSTKGRTYVTSTFTITFPNQYDVCYIAYHYPFSYSALMTQIWKLTKSIDLTNTLLKVDLLCSSINNNQVPLLTISAHDKEKNKLSEREIIVLTARVHPGECNSSWVMSGVLNFLMGNSQKADDLRKKYIFKIVPMLNVDGVINGCDRCGLTDEDLNRCWIRPNQYLHPVIYHTKGMVEYLVRVLNKTPSLYCDFHGHSRRKNVFVYGCSHEHSWFKTDRSIPENPADFLMLPHLMDRFNPAFALSNCNFSVEKNRESTARVTFWREFGIMRSYTMESTYCGMDQGTLSGFHINTTHLKEVGVSFCEALLSISDDAGWRLALVLDHPETDTARDEDVPADESNDNLSCDSSDEEF